MKTSNDQLLLKPIQKPTSPSPNVKPAASSARPMKSMMRVKSIRPQRIDLRRTLKRNSNA